MQSETRGCGYPDEIRDGLHAFQYYNLAKIYLSEYDLERAQICVAKLKASDGEYKGDGERLAAMLEDVFMPRFAVSSDALRKLKEALAQDEDEEEKTVAICRKLIEEFPQFEWPLLVLARYPSKRDGKTEPVIKAEHKNLMQRVLEINPHNVEAILNLAWLESSYDGDNAKPDEYYRRAKELYPDVVKHLKFREPIAPEVLEQRQREAEESLNESKRQWQERLARELEEVQKRDQLALESQAEAQAPAAENHFKNESKRLFNADKLDLFLDKEGKIALRCGPHYKASERFSEGMLVVKSEDQRKIFKNVQVWNTDGDKVFEVSDGEAHAFFSEGLLGLKKQWDNGGPFYQGFINTTGEVVFRGQSFDAGPFKEGMSQFQSLSTIDGAHPWGFQNRAGKIQIEPIYNDAYDFSEGLAAVSLNGKIGYINQSGIFVIPPRYDMARPFSEGIAHVVIIEEQERTWDAQYIDTTGEVQFHIKQTISGLEPLHENDRSGFRLNAKHSRYRSEHHSSEGDEAYDFHEGLVRAVSSDGRYGFKNKSGEFVIEPTFDYAHTFCEERALVRSGSKYGFINKQGELIIPAEYEDASQFSDGLAAVSHDGIYWGYIDGTGAPVIPEKYLNACDFAEGLARVSVEF